MSDDPSRFLQPVAPPRDTARAPRISASPGMADWLLEQRLSLAYTSYRSGRLIVVGVAPDGRLSFNEQDYARAMGLAYRDGTLHLASLFQLWRLENLLGPGEYANRAHDAVFVPRRAQTTGYLDVHELAVDGSGRAVFVNSLYSCLATLDGRLSFRPLWKPPFVTALVAEDRCHLNGVAMADGAVRYVTAFAASDDAGGWRRDRVDGGLLIDVVQDRVVTDRLSMPHSPRAFEDGVLVLDSGRGWLVRIDPASGAAQDLVFCPGFLRGLAIVGRFALVTVSKPRHGDFGALPLQAELAARGMAPWCGILVIDLDAGGIAEFIRYESEVGEMFDVAVLPGIRNPMTIGPATEELLTTVRFDPTLASSL